MNEINSQVERIFAIYRMLLSGKKLKTSEIRERLLNDHGGDYSPRTIQRDMQTLLAIAPEITFTEEGRTTIWHIDENLRSGIIFRENDLLSLYMLKANLKNFKGTYFEEEINALLNKIDSHAVGDVFDGEPFFWDKNIGSYDYSGHDRIIKKVIEAITQKQWVTIDYDVSGSGYQKSYIGRIARMFSNAGYLYAAVYIPEYQYYIAMAIHRITDIQEAVHEDVEVPDFNQEKFSAIRFGVFWGEPEKVEIIINADSRKYFENRFWHQTQKFKDNEDGSLSLEMLVPLSPELKSWLISWSSCISSVKPEKLRDELISMHKEALKNLEG